MRMQIAPEIADSIRELHELGWSQRKLAKRFEISTTTVHRIVKERWHPVDQHEDPFWELKLKAERCTGFGGLVYDWPCRTCDIRGLLARQQVTTHKLTRAA